MVHNDDIGRLRMYLDADAKLHGEEISETKPSLERAERTERQHSSQTGLLMLVQRYLLSTAYTYMNNALICCI
jgi:hypothetical protein